MPWQQWHPLCFFQSTRKSCKREEGGENSVNYRFFFLETSDHPGAVVGHPHQCDLQPLTQHRAGRIILMLLVNCSQITPLEAQLWFYSMQLLCVKWGWCFQETGALMECSGSSKVLSLCWIMEVSILNWIHQTGLAWSWGASPSLQQPLPSFQNYTLAPSAEQSAMRSFFLSGKNWRLNCIFGRFAIFLVLIRASMQLLSFLLWARACWRSLLAVLAWQTWCDQLSFVQVKFSLQIWS